jgi:hypothetical protein
VNLYERILALMTPGRPKSVEELAAEIPEASPASILAACMEMREQRKLGRNGAGKPGSPFRFYLKKTKRP